MRFELFFILQDMQVKPGEVKDEQRKRCPGSQCGEKTSHEDELAEINRVAHVAIGTFGDNLDRKRI